MPTLFPAKGLFSQILDYSFHAKGNGMEGIKRYPKADHVENCFIMFGRVLMKLLRKEVAKHIPFPNPDYDCIDAGIVFTTSKVELLCNHIQENISSLFICYGCLEGYENQLGHECV
ncbi:hypothetical protein TNCT_296891 [Trichonephila clavata]|uniref:Uncharacterized protein n=1 Tax=Trichonephila clavata TaxID=2740835 RepID=A0A8X6FGS8_TRICU|nr:hypothetical protein TNCT_296891 [Trichonephila clavata]